MNLIQELQTIEPLPVEQTAVNPRVCWNCSGYVRLREKCCPRCGAERLSASPVVWQEPPRQTAWQSMKYAGFFAGLLAGLAWLALHRGTLFG